MRDVTIEVAPESNESLFIFRNNSKGFGYARLFYSRPHDFCKGWYIKATISPGKEWTVSITKGRFYAFDKNKDDMIPCFPREVGESDEIIDLEPASAS